MKNTFPNHFINPQDKGEDWMLQMVKAIWEEWDTQSIKSFNKGAERYSINKLYALGKQSNDIYKPHFEVSDDQNSSFINLDLSPPALIPKFKRIINNKHSKIEFTINAQAIDDYAMEDKLEYEANEQANIKTRKMLQELDLDDSILNTGEVDQPLEDQELAIKMEFGYKHNMAIDIEKKIDAVFTKGRIKESLTIIRDRLFDSGVAIYKAFTDMITGEVGFREVNPSNWIVSPTNDPYFRDMWYAGEGIFMTIDEVRRECKASGVDITEGQLENLAAKNLGKNGNPNRFADAGAIGAFYYDSFKIPVFDGEFLSCNKYWYEKRWNKKGNPVIGKVKEPTKKEGREYYSDEDIVVYRFKWIINTDIMFNYGLKSDVYRKDDCLWDTHLSYLAVAPELNGMETNPMIEQMIPFVDQAVLAWYKLQNVIAKARPKGISIEIGALEDIDLGNGSAAEGGMTPLSILDMFTQTGVLVYRKINASGEATNYKPIEELEGGLGREAAGYFAIIDKFMSYMGGIIGMNEVTDGSTPDPKMLNGVAGMAIEATSNALHHLLIAERYLIEKLADEIAVRVHDSMTFKQDSPYRNVVAPSGIKSIKENKRAMHRVYGMAIEYDADQQEKMDLQKSIDIALANKEITIADSMAIKRIRNLKQAEMVLAFRINKNLEKQVAIAQQDKMTNAEASAMAAKAAEQAKIMTLQAESIEKIKVIQAEGAIKLELLREEYRLKAGIAAGDNQTKKEIAETQVEGQKEAVEIKKENSAVPEFA